MDTTVKKTIMLGGRELSLETGHLAKQASGSVLVRYGDTVVLVTATSSKEPKEGINFFPLTVEYEEKLYSVGKIPGGYLRREGKSSEQATLAARLIDRPIRPLFPKGYRHDVQIVASVLSVDQDNSPEIAAMIGASAALHLSHIPFLAPIAGVEIGYYEGDYIINPSLNADTSLSLSVAGTKEAVMMVEAGADELSEEIILEAILKGHEEIKKIVDMIDELREEALLVDLAQEKNNFILEENTDFYEVVSNYSQEKLSQALRVVNKQKRDETIQDVRKEMLEHFKEIYEDAEGDLNNSFDGLMKDIVRKLIINEHIRPDGRKLDEVRSITCEIDLLPRVHGSAVFTRGQTQILSVATLGSTRDSQRLDGIEIEDNRRYLHHYNFPPFSVGECRPMRGPGRREIGHGALARRAIEPVLPSEDIFPYTIRVVSEALESNGSTSMGSVCGSTMSLMAAGVPMVRPVSGIAMGLIREGENFAILTDLQGLEDALGDMDFKVAGTAQGVTAIQMDIKIDGISRAILEQALQQAKKGRSYILGKMLEAIAEPRKELSPYAPRIETIMINPDKIGDVIGTGGKIIKKIREETSTEIEIEDDGTVRIMALDDTSCKKAVEIIENIVKDPKIGEVYNGKIIKIMDFGAFVNILPNKDGLIHISQLAHERVKNVEDVVKVGDVVSVKIIEIDKQGRINLSRKALIESEKCN